MQPEHRERLPGDYVPELLTLAPRDVARALRSAVGLSADHPDSTERAAWYPATEPEDVIDVDAAGWIVWALAGLSVFSEGGATMRRARRELKRVLVALAMLRAGGNISAMSRAIGAPRKLVRDWMKELGLYQAPPRP